jgi:hypothetical protein
MRQRHAARNVARLAVRALLAPILIALGGCGASAGGACTLEPVARVPVTLRAGLPMIEAEIAGGPVRLVVDTGAQRTLLTEAAVRRLGLRRDPRRPTRTGAIGGTSSAWDAIAGEIQLGSGGALPLAGVAVGNFTLGPPEARADGLLGGDVWRQFDVDLDLPDGVATFYRAQSCHRVAPPWAGRVTEFTGLAGPATWLLVPVALDGVPGTAIFDTGAQVSGISRRLAARAAAGPERQVRVRGASATIARVPARRFVTFQVGPMLFTDPVLPILPMPAFTADALVGEDMLRGCRTWFSFAARQMFVAANGGADAPGGQIALACPAGRQ